MKKLILAAFIGALLSACTDNQKSKTFGGNQIVKLEKGQKFVNATWKESNLWVLTRSRHEGEPVESFTFREKSGFGLIEGKVTFEETK
jgi:hypothetical protein